MIPARSLNTNNHEAKKSEVQVDFGNFPKRTIDFEGLDPNRSVQDHEAPKLLNKEGTALSVDYFGRGNFEPGYGSLLDRMEGYPLAEGSTPTLEAARIQAYRNLAVYTTRLRGMERECPSHYTLEIGDVIGIGGWGSMKIFPEKRSEVVLLHETATLAIIEAGRQFGSGSRSHAIAKTYLVLGAVAQKAREQGIQCGPIEIKVWHAEDAFREADRSQLEGQDNLILPDADQRPQGQLARRAARRGKFRG
jgi:hypothetical protein